MQAKTAPVIRALSELSEVRGIVCYGSYALGTFDQYSDIDLYTFCQPEIVPAAARKEALQKIEGISDVQVDHAEFGWENQWCPHGDRFRLHDIFFDITFNTVDWIRTVVRKVTGESATSIPELRFRPYTMLGLFENSITLYDPDATLEEIKTALHPYPRGLKKSLIEQSLSTVKGSLQDLRDYVKRGVGNTSFHFHLEQIIDSLGVLLFALNERYDPATKRVEEVFCGLRIVPRDFMERYCAVLQIPLTEGGRSQVVEELGTLVQEIESLSKEQAEPPDGP
ncbi:MAG: nucleotidyltransferase domain-containing protein [Candidatus Hydrogenedentes bacterium]|nr:nucleotidyltransferase domain-containing protein [Candidatus Hydrogenedentota bacterium]